MNFTSPDLSAIGTPSTALWVAALRGAHQILERPPAFFDPYALAILGGAGEQWTRDHLDSLDDWGNRLTRATLVARSRFAEDALIEMIGRQATNQCIVLGAGLDTFSMRNPFPALSVFELDLPTLQKDKLERLRQLNISPPNNTRFVSADLERTNLSDALGDAGFKRERPTCITWLGVSYYIDADAVMAVLRYASSLAPGSTITFDYLTLPENSDDALNELRSERAQFCADLGEPWITAFTSEKLVAELRSLGFSRIEDVGSAELNERYFDRRQDGFRMAGNMFRVVRATRP